jgi:signal peptidase I
MIGNNMTTSTSSPIVQGPPKTSAFSGCLLNAFVVLFVILGIYALLWGSILAYVFSSAGIVSLFNVGIVFLILCQCFIYFFLAFRLKRQHWLVSLMLVAAVWLILPIVVSWMLNTSTVRVRQDGFSMGITLPNGGYILADRLSYNKNDPQRGDVIIFRFPVDPELDLIKRVIGLPGETIAVEDGKVSVNGTLLEESYITEPPAYNGSWVVPEGQYFVLGDNRNDSRDSHQWGFLPRENIVAEAVWIYLPLEHFGKIDNGNFKP